MFLFAILVGRVIKHLASDPGRACALAKEIAQDLQLVGQPQTFDMFTRDGARVTCNVSDQSKDYYNQQSMFFIREDFLRLYLERHDLSLFWAIWGERQYSHDLMANIANSTDKSEPPICCITEVQSGSNNPPPKLVESRTTKTARTTVS